MTVEKNNFLTLLRLDKIKVQDLGQLVVVRSGETIGLKLDFDIRDSACSGNCIDQIEYGLTDRIGCLFDHAVSKVDGARGNSQATFVAPVVSAPTTFPLRATIAQNFGCTYNGAHGWYGGVAPGSEHTIAYVCVH